MPRTVNEKHYVYDHEKYGENKSVGSASGVYKSAAVACDSAIGSAVGKHILEQDGSAVDAAIACLLCNSLCNAQSMGIGGGFFMIHYSKKDQKITCLDARETAPMNSTADMFKNCSKTKGGVAIAVPGEIKGYWKAHQMFGKLKWNKLFQPAIEMCNNGFPLPASQAKFLKFCESKILKSKPLRETYVNRLNNELYKANSIIKIPKLAKTLEVIARDGESAFYNGQLTDIIVDEIQSAGGIITRADLQNYECVLREPVSYTLSNKVELFSFPPPSCGIMLNFILAMMDSFDHDDFMLDFGETNALFYHRFIEACKFSFGFRSHIGDSSFDDPTDLKKYLTNKSVVKEYRDRVKDHTVLPIHDYGTGNFFVDHGTAHTSLIAPNGDAVAITSSINLVFGSKIMGDRTNILYNNQMDDFSCPSGEFNSFSLPNYSINYVQPGKRPVSSMTPLIALDENKNTRLVCGSSGGTRIITSTALIAARNLLYGKNIFEAVDDPRIHHQLSPDEVLYEEDFNSDVLRMLSKKGHNLVNFGRGGSAAQAVERLSDGSLRAVCDYRKGGIPSGF